MVNVELRRPVQSDGPELIRLNGANREYHAPWVEPFVDKEGFEAWLARAHSGSHAGFVAMDRTTGAIAGVVNLNNIIEGAFRNAFLGFYGMASCAGRGLMTEAVRLAVRLAFDEFGLHRLEANVQPGNGRSIALVKRLGFQLEGFSPCYLRVGGEWRDHERWALLADGR